MSRFQRRLVALMFAWATLSFASVAAHAQDAAPTTAVGNPDPAVTQDPEAPRLAVVLFPSVIFGVDARVGEAAYQTAQRVLEGQGYAVVSPPDSVPQRALAPNEIQQVVAQVQAHRGIQLRAWAQDGVYVVEVVVVSLDRAEPVLARQTATAQDFRARVEALMAERMPGPADWRGVQATNGVEPIGVQPVRAVGVSVRPTTVDRVLGSPRHLPERPVQPSRYAWDFTLLTQASIGLNPGSFYNQGFGARLSRRFGRVIGLGVSAQYVNVEGRNGRENTMHVALLGEARIRLSSRVGLSMPLRAELGYLFFNGVTVRLAAGLGWAFADQWELGVDLISPTIYVLPNRVGVAATFGLELIHRF